MFSKNNVVVQNVDSAFSPDSSEKTGHLLRWSNAGFTSSSKS